MSVNPYWFNEQDAEARSASSFPLRFDDQPADVPYLRLPRLSELAGELLADGSRWLTASSLFHFQRCDRRAFLDRYGDRSLRNRPTDYLQKIKQDSAAHRQTVLDAAPIQRPQYQPYDWIAGAKATLNLMLQGADRIAQGVLIAADLSGMYLVSVPDLLIKQPGQSDFGDWYYVPADIKYGKRPKRDYQVTVAFHAYVLAAVQGVWPETGWLFLREDRQYGVNLAELVPRMSDVLQNCIQTFQSQQQPEVFIAHNRCDLCHWYDYCYQQATATHHLSLIPGVTPSRYGHLQRLGISTLTDLAAASVAQLTPLPGFGESVARKVIDQAQAVLDNRAIAHTLPASGSDFPLTAADLPTAEVELYFDIEAAPEQNLVYLHGVLEVNRVQGTETFHALLAETVEQEEAVWYDLLQLAERYPQAPVYHFCPYEAQTMQRLAEKYDTDPQRIHRLLDRFVDLHRLVTESVILPVESYALKHIARWIGFDWRDAEANGAQSICWYADWLATGDRTYLDAILRYNEDDCRATHRLKDWLVEFAQPFWTASPAAQMNYPAD